MKILFFDTETTGTPPDWKTPAEQIADIYPRVVEFGAIISDEHGGEITRMETIIKSDVEIPPEAFEVHGITNEKAATGLSERFAMVMFNYLLNSVDVVVCHNVAFDVNMLIASAVRLKAMSFLERLKTTPEICTKVYGTDYCKIPSQYGGYKWPTLIELYAKLFNKELVQDHRAMTDIEATKECFFEMVNIGLIDLSKYCKT